jgi:hypothetical protein
METIFAKYDSKAFPYGTDKGTTHSYLSAYEGLFSPIQSDKIRLLEVGVWTGASLMAWSDYFTHADAEIYGVDIANNIRFDLAKTSKIKFATLDATRPDHLKNIDGNFDIIIDDGSHTFSHQMTTLYLLKDRINENGLYIIEDIQDESYVEYLQKFAESIGFNSEVFDTRPLKGRYDDIMIVFRKN